MIYILDASVVLKWFVKEEGTIEALEFKRRYGNGEITISSPDLLIYEVANVLRFKKDFPEVAAKESLRSLLALGLELFSPSEFILEESIHLSYQSSLSIYACFYLALASKFNAPLITADKKIYNASQTLPVSVKLL